MPEGPMIHPHPDPPLAGEGGQSIGGQVFIFMRIIKLTKFIISAIG